MHAVLKEGEETLFTHPLPPARAERLSAIKDGCDRVLADLESLVQKYESLGTQSKRTWDRMKWGNEDIAEIRARLTSNVTMLAAFISTSQVSIEAKLDKFIEEFHQGKKEGSVVSLQTVDSLSAGDRAVWRTIRKELENIGIGVAAFDANRNFIFDWFVRAVETGAFEEQNGSDVDDENENDYRDEQGSWSDDEQDEKDISLGGISEDQLLATPQPSESAADTELDAPKRGPTTFDEQRADIRWKKREYRTRVPRLTALLARMSRPRYRLIKAVDTSDVSKALMILKDKASLQLLDVETLNQALFSTCRQAGVSESCLLISELIARGANVNYVQFFGRTPLWASVVNGSIDMVRILIENGADVNYKGRADFGDSMFAPRASLRDDTAILQLLLSMSVDINAEYTWDGSTVTLIHEAAYLGAVPAIEILLHHGAKIDAVASTDGTALMIALSERRLAVARFLLAKGANPKYEATPDKNYKAYGTVIDSFSIETTYKRVELPFKNPLEAAIIGGDPSMVMLLLGRGAVPDGSTLEFLEKMDKLKITGKERESEYREIKRILEEKIKGKDTAESRTSTQL